ncbi:putative ABC transporter permease [Butyrivibrio sp. AE2032]|uniref:putative ABC transporter permease n=1 Tax=Butyrivibrio sp. AE2032 TaxID=1458463 RepID=UPI0005524C69|nr:putative ABC transporter permease [Butyrivibrio sp. AE2032]
MNKEYLKKRFPLLMLIFAFGGVFGFIYEEIFYRFDLGEWVKRGTTFGPWIPIYGFGGLLILGFTFKVRKNPFLVFLLATVASGVLELATGWVVLTVFGIRLWDYNEEILNWGNIGGFVCARSVLFFGVSGVFLRFVLVPLFEKIEQKLPRKAWLALCFIPAGLFAADIIVSLICKAAGV